MKVLRLKIVVRSSNRYFLGRDFLIITDRYVGKWITLVIPNFVGNGKEKKMGRETFSTYVETWNTFFFFLPFFLFSLLFFFFFLSCSFLHIYLLLHPDIFLLSTNSKSFHENILRVWVGYDFLRYTWIQRIHKYKRKTLCTFGCTRNTSFYAHACINLTPQK